MSLDDALTVVDQYEARHGNTSAVERACDFLISYMPLLPNPPGIARRALDIAKQYRKGHVNNLSLQEARAALADFLTEQMAWTKWNDPHFAEIYAIYAILTCLEIPTHGGGASEIISNVLAGTETLRPNDEVVRSLLTQHFSPSSP